MPADSRRSARLARLARLLAKLLIEAASLFLKLFRGAPVDPKTDDVAKCNYCPYRSFCNRGVKAGDGLDAELETEAEELFDINFEQIGEIEF